MSDKDFGAIRIYKKDHAIFKSIADEKGFKLCTLFNKIMKKFYPKKYEVK